MSLSITDSRPACSSTSLDVDGDINCSVSKIFKSSKSNQPSPEDLASSKRQQNHAIERNDISDGNTSQPFERKTTEGETDHSELQDVELAPSAGYSNADGKSPDPKIVDANLLTWAQCDLCSKWRQLPSDVNIDQNTTFTCTDVKGWNCDMPEEPASGQFELPLSSKDSTGNATEHPTVAKDTPVTNSETQTAKKLCPSCGAGVQGLEEHYRLSPQCQPSKEITPNWVSGLVLDLSDRIPYRAVTHKDLRIWRKFASRARSCSTYRGATRQLLWLYEQLRPAVLCQGWLAARQDQFRRDCESCDDPQLAVQLVNQVELEAIDWVVIHRLWAQERGADAAHVAGQESGAAEQSGGDDKKDEKHTLVGKQRGLNSISKCAENERQKRRYAAQARWDRCKAARSTSLPLAQSENQSAENALNPECSAQSDASAQGSQESEDAYTLGSLVEVTLDDGEQAVAIITAVPERGAGGGAADHEVAFLDAKGLIVRDDRLRLPLPNRFVSMALPCPPCGRLPRGWIPAAGGAAGCCCYVGPDGRVCETREEMLRLAAADAGGGDAPA
jgi:hypothetical protein